MSKTASDSTHEVRTYRTPDGSKEIVLDDKLLIIRTGEEYFQAGVSSTNGSTYMHVHVPGLDILVAELRFAGGTDTWQLNGIDALYPGLSEQRFERAEETMYDGTYCPLPEFVPTTAFLAKLTDGDFVEYIMAIRELRTGKWYIFFLNDRLSGGLTYVPNIGSAGIAAISFKVDNHHYNLANSPFDNTGPHYMRDGQPIEYVDPEQYHIEVTWPSTVMAYVQLTPLAHAQQ